MPRGADRGAGRCPGADRGAGRCPEGGSRRWAVPRADRGAGRCPRPARYPGNGRWPDAQDPELSSPSSSPRHQTLQLCRAMKQLAFFPAPSIEHGGVLAVGRRRSRRALSTKRALHITLKSEFAYAKRSLLNHRALIYRIQKKASRRFGVRVYQLAICGNHLHALVRGRRREDMQNFFRVFAGHIAQAILTDFPITNDERRSKKEERADVRKKQTEILELSSLFPDRQLGAGIWNRFPLHHPKHAGGAEHFGLSTAKAKTENSRTLTERYWARAR